MIYLIKSGKYLKIGFAEDVNKRLQGYNTHNPDFILLDSKDGTIEDEKILHKLCSPWLHRNEWFKDVPEVRKFWNDYQKTVEYDIIKLKKEIEDLKNQLKNYNLTENLLKQEYQNELKNNYEQITIILHEMSQLLLNGDKQAIIEIIKHIVNFAEDLINIGKRHKLNQNTEILLCKITDNVKRFLNKQ